jgi:MoaA/NifB/PqqE/SkfB family radical SAM enzyme
MCDIWKINKEDKSLIKKELSIQEIINFLDQNKESLKKLKNIGITGGEPTLKKGLPELFRYLSVNFPNTGVGLQTHGLFPKTQLPILEELYSIYPSMGLAVSLDGGEEIHEKVRGVKGAYQRAITTIKGAKQIGIKEITVGLTISKENIVDIPKVRAVCQELECEFSCFLAEAGDYFSNSNNENLGFNDAEKQAVVSALESFKYHYYMDNTRLQLLNKRLREINCYSGQSSIVLDPYGNIKPCLILDEVFGNIKTATLKEIFASVQSKRIELKKCKKCFLQCEVGTSVLMDFTDLIKWFLFHCEDRTGFLRTYLTKYNKKLYKSM